MSQRKFFRRFQPTFIRAKKADRRIERAVAATFEQLDARLLLSETVFSNDFEGGVTTDRKGTIEGGSITAMPSYPSQHFLGPTDDASLKLSGLAKRTYALQFSATLYLIGDTDPHLNPYGGTNVGGLYAGAGGPDLKIKVGDDQVIDADFAHNWTFWTEYGNPDNPHVTPSLALPGDIGYDYEGNVWTPASETSHYCDNTHMGAAYSIHFMVPVLDQNSVSISLNATGGGPAKFGLDDVQVTEYTYSICRTCSGNPDGEPLQSTRGASGNAAGGSATRNDPSDIGAGNGAAEIPELFWVGPDEEPGINAHGWTNDEWVGSPLVAVYTLDGGKPVWFDATKYPSPTFQVKNGEKYKLALDEDNHWLVLTDADGGRSYYEDDTGAAGRFINYVDKDGNEWDANSSGDITSITQAGDANEATNYSYSGGHLSSVTVTRSPISGTYTVRSASYDYYSGGETYGGNSGDLEFEHISNDQGETDTSYYRYWTSGDSDFSTAHAWVGAPKFEFGPQAYARLLAAYPGSSVADLSDLQVKDYADTYYKSFNNADDRRVTEEVIAGRGDLLISTTTRPTNVTSVGTNLATVDGYNIWKFRTDTTYPDGSHDIVYKNYLGAIMLEVFKDGSGNERPVMFDEYGEDSYDAGQVILEAKPSAFALVSSKYYDDTKADLLYKVSGNYTYLNDSAGLVETTGYYSSTTASGTNAGGVEGYFKQSMVQRGETGTPIRQNKTLYFSHTSGSNAGTITIYPVAQEIQYASAGVDADTEYGTQPRVTSYQYFFTGDDTSGTVADDSNHMVWRKTIAPPILYSQNGPATSTSDTSAADTTTEYFDHFGRVTWSKDGNGSISLSEYDTDTGAVLKTIADVSYASLSGDEQSDYPSGWSTNHAGLNLVTTYDVDLQGRVTKLTDPNGNVTYTVYDDLDHEVRTYRGFDGTNTTGPIEIAREDRDGSYTEQLTLATSPHLDGSGAPDGTETITAADIRSLTRTHTNAQGQTDESDRYVSLASQTYATGAASFHIGSAGTNYYGTTYGYDDLGRQNRVVNPLGTITRTVFDAMGRTSSTWVGTDDTPSSGSWSPSNTNGTDLTKLSESLYDTYDPAITVVGDSNLTRTTGFANGTTSAHVTDFYYDWRDRQVASKSGVLLNGSNQPDQAGETNSASVQRLVSYTTYDNLGEVTQQDQYDGDGAVMVTSNAPTDSGNDGVPDAPSGTNTLRARLTTDYDDQGRVWRSSVFRVDQSSGAVTSTALRTWNWYDHRGSLIKTFAPGGLATKYAYDGAGRVTAEYMTDGGGDAPIAATNGGSWWNAGTLDGDHVLEQHENQYDADGNPIFMTTRMRFHDAPEPGATNSGDLSVGANTSWARVSFSTAYYDAANRLTDSVDVGTYGGTNGAYSRPSPNAPTNRSGVLLLNHYDYNDAGEMETVTDPRGIASKTYYDLLGRTTKTIANYVDGVAANADDDQIIEYTYDGGDHILTMKAVVNNAGAYSGTNSVFQTTQYIYGVTTGGGNGVNSNDLLKEVRYPDKTTGSASTNAANIEAYTYDTLGERKTLADRNGSTHTYSYDVLGRMLTDNVTTLGSGVDGTVRRLDYNYDTGGRAYQMTSYGNTNGTGTPINQIQYAYNGYGQLTTEYQEHAGAVSTNTANVQYAYSEGGTDVTNLSDDNSRLTSITYPNGRVLRYEYGASDSLSNRISRLAFLADDANGAASTHIEEYSYLGLSTVVIRNRPSANSKLTYVKQGTESDGEAGDKYTGLDRFGRIADQRWVGQSGSSATTLDRFQYGYDADSNPLYKNNLGSGTVAASFSELYHTNGTSGASTSYDGLNRLTDFRRGTLSDLNSDGAYDTVSTLNTLAGSSKNWSLDAVGNWNSSTTGTNSAVVRTNDKQNEVTAVGGNSLMFDNAGNTTTDESGNVLTYDAWNRLVTFGTSGTNTTQTYTYDAAGRRTSEDPGTTRDLYYSNQWQVLEEREGGSAKSQNVWSPTYVDELIERDRDNDSTADATLDTSFDSDGKVTTSFGNNFNFLDEAKAVVVQPDGKTLAVGLDGFFVTMVRYNRDGSLDSSFGSSGKVEANLASDFSQSALAVALQPDGKIVIAGNTGTVLFVGRFTATGSFDTSFDSDGKKTFDYFGDNPQAKGLAVQANGKILVGARALDSDTSVAFGVVFRLNADGSLDNSYGGGDGMADTGPAFTASAMALQPDGMVVLGRSGSGAFNFVRFDDTGAIDTSFDSDGFATISFGAGTASASLKSLAVQGDGKIVAFGNFGGDFALTRINVDGSADNSFDSDGATTADMGGTDVGQAIRLQSDGKIVTAGYSAGDLVVARFTEAGALDTSFDSDGHVSTDFGSTDDRDNDLWIGPDYKVTTVGRTGTNGATYDFAVARYVVASGLEERLYAQTDANHNVTSVADVFGAVKERFVYDPYRESMVLTNSWLSTSDGYTWTVRSQGEREDLATDTIDGRSRIYGLRVGRWMQADFDRYADGSNLYQFEKTSPIAHTDPTGNQAVASGVSIALADGPALMNNRRMDFDFATITSGLLADTSYFQLNTIYREFVYKGDDPYAKDAVTHHFEFGTIIDREHTAKEGSRVTPVASPVSGKSIAIDPAHQYLDQQQGTTTSTYCYYKESRRIEIYLTNRFIGGQVTDDFLEGVDLGMGKTTIGTFNPPPVSGQYGVAIASGPPVASYSFTYIYIDPGNRIREALKFEGLQGATAIRTSI